MRSGEKDWQGFAKEKDKAKACNEGRKKVVEKTPHKIRGKKEKNREKGRTARPLDSEGGWLIRIHRGRKETFIPGGRSLKNKNCWVKRKVADG